MADGVTPDLLSDFTRTNVDWLRGTTATQERERRFFAAPQEGTDCRKS